jgi:type VI protein secretion system component VasK
VAGYLIAVVAFALPFVFGATGSGRSRIVLGIGALVALGWFFALAVNKPQNESGQALLPLWLLAGLAGLLYVIWCGGLWLGLRLRKARAE